MMPNKSEKLIPHPPLKEYYKHKDLRKEFVDKTFNNTASKYDYFNQIFSLGSGDWYRKQALHRAGLDSKMSVLDVATGTGLVAKSEVSIVGPEGKVIGLDRSCNMLKKAGEKLNIPLILGDAGKLPFQNDTFDFLSMGYALRHVDDLKGTLFSTRYIWRTGPSYEKFDSDFLYYFLHCTFWMHPSHFF